MRLYYFTPDGRRKSIPLGDQPLTVGRSADADIVLLDEQASREHCVLRLDDGAYCLKDLQSKNGTFVNDQRIEVHALSPGEHIRVGRSVFVYENDHAGPEATAVLREMQQEMNRDQGVGKVLREIVDQSGTRAKPAAAPAERFTGPAAWAEAAAPAPEHAPPAQPPAEAAKAPARGAPQAEPEEKPPGPAAKRKVISGKKKTGGKKIVTKKSASKRPPLKVRIRKPKRDGAGGSGEVPER